MLRRRRTSRAGAEDDDPQDEEAHQIIGQEMVAVEVQPEAPRRDGLEIVEAAGEEPLSTPTRSTTVRQDTGTGLTEIETLEGPRGKPRVLAPLNAPSGQPPLFSQDQLRSARAQAMKKRVGGQRTKEAVKGRV